MRKGPLTFGALLLFLCTAAFAQDLRIPIPKRSKATPVQQLNRDGVKAVEAHNYDKAKKLFYKAYLLDPNDPFTLNNLGYMAELDGDLDRAQRYYGLAADLSSDALVDKATSDQVEGKAVAEVAGNAQDRNMQVNRLNIQAMSLLMKDRAPEADIVLQKALKVDPKNPFTLNNMGFAKEKEGELQDALSYYTAAAATRSQEKVVVASNADWRGKPINEIADRNAQKVRKDMQDLNGNAERQVALLNLRGVSALNRNDVEQARKLFQQAYKLDPQNAFAVNNMGYIAELEGDRETASLYYARAREAEHADSTVHMATRKEAEGQKLNQVAQQSDTKVQATMAAAVEARRRRGEPVELRRRDNSVVQPLELPASDTTPVNPPEQPKARPENLQPPPVPRSFGNPADQPPSNPANPPPGNPAAQPSSGGVIPPLPDNQQPPAAGTPPSSTNESQPGVQKVIPPLPDNQQPPATQPKPPASSNQPPASSVIPPLPEGQQPPAAATSQPSQTQPNANPTPPSGNQGQTQGVIPPLPDEQQPPGAKQPSNQPPNQRPQPPGQQPSSQRPPQ